MIESSAIQLQENDKIKTQGAALKYDSIQNESITSIQDNKESIFKELQWLIDIINSRIKNIAQLTNDNDEGIIKEIKSPPELTSGAYYDFIKQFQLDYSERLLIILCFAVRFSPVNINRLFSELKTTDKSLHIYGGMSDEISNQFLPTLETFFFLLAGPDQSLKADYFSIFTEKHKLFKERIVTFEYPARSHLPQTDPILILDPLYTHFFLTGETPRLDYGVDFPAHLLETEQTFDDLILPDDKYEELEEIINFTRYNRALFSKEDARKVYSPGYVAMFYGPSGTGKTMTAALLGKNCNVPVYKIDLSRVISKYIGETEKNLERVFTRLEGKNVMLFFDEADAIFGKRTDISDSKDRYANQEVSYLLQRIENWDGVVILSTNFKQNLDDAFKRRIIKYVFFAPPKYPELLQLWKKKLPSSFQYQSEDIIEKLARTYPFTGGNITSILKRACIEAIHRESAIITREILNPIIRDECAQYHNIQYRSI